MTLCVGVFLFELILYGISLHFLDMEDCFLSQVREVFSSDVFKYVPSPLFLSLLLLRPLKC